MKSFLEKIYTEVCYFFRMVDEKLEFKPYREQLGKAVSDVYSQYKTSSPQQKQYLKMVLALLTLVLLCVVIYQARNMPKLARLLHLSVPVEGFVVKKGEITRIIGASGLVTERSQIQLNSFLQQKYVQSVNVNNGDLVKKGTVLMRVDPKPFLDDVESTKESILAAQDKVKTSEQTLAALRELSEKHLASQIELDQADQTVALSRQELAKDQSNLIEAQQQLDFTQLKASIESVVITRSVNPGDTLMTGSPLFTLGDISSVYLVALEQEDTLPFIQREQVAEVVFASLPTQKFQGIVKNINATVDPNSRTFSAYILISNPRHILSPGITGYSRIGIKAEGLVIPATAVMNKYSQDASVFLVNRDSRAVLNSVRLGLKGEGGYQVLDGLKEGDVVVSDGTQYLQNNELVHVNYP